MTTAPAPRGQLCIWTDVDPASELDFNRWYDREHMQERVAIPGFQSASRFQATGECPRPYLALYYTDAVAVFTSDAYRQAFAHQTDWSLRNFERMRGTQRRVGPLEIEVGHGEGGALALFVVAQDKLSMNALRDQLARLRQEDFIIRASVLRTDTGLSAPVTADSSAAPADAVMMIEATRAQAALAQARSLAAALDVPSQEVYGFRLLWRLGA